MADSAQQPTERATPRREREARKRGQVPRSRELATALIVGTCVLLLAASGAGLAQAGMALMRSGLHVEPELLGHPLAIAARLPAQLAQALLVVAPLLGAGVIAALAGPWLLGGWNFAPEALKPDFSRINPGAGLKRMFAGHGAMELLKGLLKLALLSAVAAAFLWQRRALLVGVSAQPPAAAIAQSLQLAMSLLIWLTAALFAVALIDAPWQRWQHLKKLRMTRQEVKDEFRQNEGRPEVKARIRRLQHEMAKRRMMEKVPQADVVVTNPTHYAVALQYAAGRMRAPRLVAKGAGPVAEAIRALAREHRVPLVEAPPLARALYRHVDFDEEIPAALYAAVAQVLTYVYRLRNWRGGAQPPLPALGEIEGGEPDAPT